MWIVIFIVLMFFILVDSVINGEDNFLDRTFGNRAGDQDIDLSLYAESLIPDRRPPPVIRTNPDGTVTVSSGFMSVTYSRSEAERRGFTL